MDEMLLPKTAMANLGPQRQPGLLGKGTLPSAPDMQMGAFTCSPLNIGGLYATDDYGAAMFLANDLQSPDPGMSAAELEAAALMLRDLMAKLYKEGKVGFEEMVELQKAAEGIPVIGPLMFSAANLPGTLAGVGGLIAGAAQTTSVNNLLDMTPALRKKLQAWAKSGGSKNYTKANRHFKGRIKLVRVNGVLHLEIPLTAQATNYRILNKSGNTHVRVPAAGTAPRLGKWSWVHANGATGAAKVLSGNSVGALLAVGPQAYIDATNSNSVHEFLNKSAYSQPTNVAAFGAGVVVSVVFASTAVPFVVVLAIGLSAGWLAQYAMGESGADKSIGDFLTKW
ncbi:hypothetical protein [Pseudomonas eucalypticola]|uniref:Uncharacterized protein n=1 Tax=Pseudomonas eucalypticola TaxID=2599595 RepID=A0A7D5D497_9PSED|nr:hypothetical protein [Pseudomonas eucalypticola]QKZ02398.1 hypothetical protein HWQ56_00755 [Pseudomonas eucalypticola]